MSIDKSAIEAAAAERAKAREVLMQGKTRARMEKEREARLEEREKDRQLVMGAGAAFVAGSGSGSYGSTFAEFGSMGMNADAVSKNLKVIAAGGSPKLPNTVAKVLKKKSGQLSIALEYKRVGPGGEDDEINHVDFRRSLSCSARKSWMHYSSTPQPRAAWTTVRASSRSRRVPRAASPAPCRL